MLTLTFANIYVVPTIVNILEEFAIADTSSWLFEGITPTWIFTVVGGTVVLLISIVILLGRFFGWQPRWLPLMPAAADSRSQILNGVADAIDQGLSYDDAFKLGYDISLRRREGKAFFRASSCVRSGMDPIKAMRAVNWISRQEHEWLTDAQPSRAAQLLRHFADRRLSDAAANMKWLMSVLFPAIVILFGIAIFFYAYGFMIALNSLIVGLS